MALWILHIIDDFSKDTWAINILSMMKSFRLAIKKTFKYQGKGVYI